MSQTERHSLPKIEAGESSNELSVERAKGLIFKSFELSQGSNPLLVAMWSYIHMRFPNLKVSEQVMQIVTSKLTPVFKKLLVAGAKNPGIHSTINPDDNTPITDQSIVDSVDDNFTIFESTINGTSGNNFLDDGIKRILKFILVNQAQIDYTYLVEQNGRPGDPTKKDIWDSNVCKYVLKKPSEKTQYVEYDKMFEELRELYPSLQAQDAYTELFEKVNAVVSVYNSKHPDQLVTNLV